MPGQFIIFEVEGTGRDKQASEENALARFKLLAKEITGANVQCCTLLDQSTPKSFERILHISKGTA